MPASIDEVAEEHRLTTVLGQGESRCVEERVPSAGIVLCCNGSAAESWLSVEFLVLVLVL